MANTFTSLIPDIYAGFDVLSRELTGFIPSVAINQGGDTLTRAAKDQSVLVPITPAGSGVDVSPAMQVPEPADQTTDTAEIKITKVRAYPFGLTGEEVHGLDTGPGAGTLQGDMIAQAIRGLVNEVEADLAGLYINSSRAYGTAGTSPFGSDLSDAAEVRKILDDNGAPGTGRACIVNTSAGVGMRSLAQLTNVNQAGTGMTLRTGELANLFDISFKESGQIKSHTKGTGAGFVTNLASTLPVGSTTITVDTGSGTIVAGDVVTFDGDDNKYIVATALSGGSFTINGPGLRQTLADGVAVTVGNNFDANFAFSQNAMQLVARPPAMPREGDSAFDRMVMIDPFSGLPFEFRAYKGYNKNRYEVALAWGVANIKPEHTAMLLG